MIDLNAMVVPTQSNGKIEFLDLSSKMTKVLKARTTSVFDLKFMCEIKEDKDGNLLKKYNFVLNKSFLENQQEVSFWTMGMNGDKAYLIQSLDGTYGGNRAMMKVWKSTDCTNKITSEAAYSILETAKILDSNTAIQLLTLTKIETNLSNCNVFEVSLPVNEDIVVGEVNTDTEETEEVVEQVEA